MTQKGMVDIYIMGKRYEVPESLTIMKAMEYAGYRLIRGCGCRSGFCGACATVYRVRDDPKLHFALACQEVVKPGMYLVQIPFFPAERASYKLHELEPTPGLQAVSQSFTVPQLRGLHQSLPPRPGCEGLYGRHHERRYSLGGPKVLRLHYVWPLRCPLPHGAISVSRCPLVPASLRQISGTQVEAPRGTGEGDTKRQVR